jgi:hypothetical protein
LSSERQIGMGVGPIPRSAIMAYAAEFDIVGDDRDVFYRMLRTMDGHYLSQVNSSSKPEKGTQASVDDVEGVRGVFDRIQARAQSARKKPRKEQTH